MGGLKIHSFGVLDICKKTYRAFKEAKKKDSKLILKDKLQDIVNTILRQMGTRISRLFLQLNDHQLEFQIEDDYVLRLVKTVACCFTCAFYFSSAGIPTRALATVKLTLGPS